MNKKYTIEEFLKATFIFRNVSDSCVKEVMRFLFKQRFSDGNIIYQTGDPVTTLFIVESGKVEIYKTDMEGNRLTMWFIHPGEVFCIPALLTGAAIANAIAVKDTVLYCLDKHDFNYLVPRYPEILNNLLSCLSSRVISYSDCLEIIAFNNAKTNIAKMLLKYHCSDENGKKVIPFSQCELASLVGTSRETACRVLNQFKREALITVEKRKIIITDIGKLQEISN